MSGAQNSQFALVRFTHDGDAPSVVPTNWLVGKQHCYWPPEDMKDPKAVIKRRVPSDTWTMHHIKILKEYETFKEAQSLLKKAELTSNLESDEDDARSARRRKARKTFSDYSDESESVEDEQLVQNLPKTHKSDQNSLRPVPIPSQLQDRALQASGGANMAEDNLAVHTGSSAASTSVDGPSTSVVACLESYHVSDAEQCSGGLDDELAENSTTLSTSSLSFTTGGRGGLTPQSRGDRGAARGRGGVGAQGRGGFGAPQRSSVLTSPQGRSDTQNRADQMSPQDRHSILTPRAERSQEKERNTVRSTAASRGRRPSTQNGDQAFAALIDAGWETPASAHNTSFTESQSDREGCEAIAQDNAAVLKPLLARLVRIEQKLDKCLNQQELILQHMGMTSGPIEDLPPEVQLPVQSAAALVALNVAMADNKIRVLVQSRLANVGGRTIGDTTRRLLSSLMITEAALELNYEGNRGSKTGISKLKIVMDVIHGAVRTNIYTSTATDDEIDAVVKSWLAGASDRKLSNGKGGRKRKQPDSDDDFGL